MTHAKYDEIVQLVVTRTRGRRDVPVATIFHVDYVGDAADVAGDYFWRSNVPPTSRSIYPSICLYIHHLSHFTSALGFRLKACTVHHRFDCTVWIAERGGSFISARPAPSETEKEREREREATNDNKTAVHAVVLSVESVMSD